MKQKDMEHTFGMLHISELDKFLWQNLQKELFWLSQMILLLYI